MALDLANFGALARDAVQYHWEVRHGEHLGPGQKVRDAVRRGIHLDGFVNLFCRVAEANGIGGTHVFKQKTVSTVPGYYRATKSWDLVIVYDGILVAALEMKSQVGSVGKNFNNRTEEALGSGVDLRTAFREHALGEDAPKPFMGYLMLLEDNAEAHKPRRSSCPHFPVLPEFKRASFATRYHLLCRKLVTEGLYDAAALLLSSSEEGYNEGAYRAHEKATGLERLVTEFAGHVASIAAQSR